MATRVTIDLPSALYRRFRSAVPWGLRSQALLPVIEMVSKAMLRGDLGIDDLMGGRFQLVKLSAGTDRNSINSSGNREDEE